MKTIESSGLIKTYGTVHAVNNLSFSIEENKITGLIGRNGAGKTTLLRLITGYLKPTAGEIRVFDQDPFNHLEVAANTIYVDDTMTFPPSLTLENILSSVAPFYRHWSEKLARGLMDYFSFNPKQRHHNLSKGTKSTFNAILGLAARCPLTLFDEPTTGMDSAVRKDFYRALLKDYIEYPRTILLSSHLLSEVEELLEDILLMKNGTKCLHLPVPDFKEYAIGLRGHIETVTKLSGDLPLIYREKLAGERLYAVIKRDDIRGRLELAREQGIEILPVAADDLCVYLTAKTEGGIDDVFKAS